MNTQREPFGEEKRPNLSQISHFFFLFHLFTAFAHTKQQLEKQGG
jgi:hypothetical protein